MKNTLRKAMLFFGLGALMGAQQQHDFDPTKLFEKNPHTGSGKGGRRKTKKPEHEAIKATKRKRRIIKASRKNNHPVHKRKASFRAKKKAA